MIDIQLFVGCAICGWQQGCPREDLPPSAQEGGACEAGGPGPRVGFLLLHVPSPQRLPCPPAPAWHLMTGLNSPNSLSKGAIRAYGLSIATGFHCPPTPAWHLMTCLNPPNPLFKGAYQASVRTRAHGHRFAVLRPASDDALSILRTVLFRLPSPEKVYRC